MNSVPWKYRNVINPWQTTKEIRLAAKFIDKMLKGWIPERVYEICRSSAPDRDWSKPT